MPTAPPNSDPDVTDWEAVAAAMARMGPIRVPVTPAEAFQLVAVLQLALRDPGLDPAHSEAGRTAQRVARLLESALLRRVPALRPVMAAGWDQSQDVETHLPHRTGAPAGPAD